MKLAKKEPSVKPATTAAKPAAAPKVVVAVSSDLRHMLIQYPQKTSTTTTKPKAEKKTTTAKPKAEKKTTTAKKVGAPKKTAAAKPKANTATKRATVSQVYYDSFNPIADACDSLRLLLLSCPWRLFLERPSRGASPKVRPSLLLLQRRPQPRKPLLPRRRLRRRKLLPLLKRLHNLVALDGSGQRLSGNACARSWGMETGFQCIMAMANFSASHGSTDPYEADLH